MVKFHRSNSHQQTTRMTKGKAGSPRTRMPGRRNHVERYSPPNIVLDDVDVDDEDDDDDYFVKSTSLSQELDEPFALDEQQQPQEPQQEEDLKLEREQSTKTASSVATAPSTSHTGFSELFGFSSMNISSAVAPSVAPPPATTTTTSSDDQNTRSAISLALDEAERAVLGSSFDPSVFTVDEDGAVLSNISSRELSNISSREDTRDGEEGDEEQEDQEEEDEDDDDETSSAASSIPTIPSTLHATPNNAILTSYKPKADTTKHTRQLNHPSAPLKLSSKIDVDDAISHYTKMSRLLGVVDQNTNNPELPVITCNASTLSKDTVEPVNLIELKHVLENESPEEIGVLYDAIMKELNVKTSDGREIDEIDGTTSRSRSENGDGLEDDGEDSSLTSSLNSIISESHYAQDDNDNVGKNGNGNNNNAEGSKKRMDQHVDKVVTLLDCYASIAGGSTLVTSFGGGTITTKSRSDSVESVEMIPLVPSVVGCVNKKEQRDRRIAAAAAEKEKVESVVGGDNNDGAKSKAKSQPSKPSFVSRRLSSGGKPPLAVRSTTTSNTNNNNSSLFKQLFSKKKRHVAAMSSNIKAQVVIATPEGVEVSPKALVVDSTSNDDANNNNKVPSGYESNGISQFNEAIKNDDTMSTSEEHSSKKPVSKSPPKDGCDVEGSGSLLPTNLPWVTSAATGMTELSKVSNECKGFEVVHDDARGKNKIMVSKSSSRKKKTTSSKSKNSNAACSRVRSSKTGMTIVTPAYQDEEEISNNNNKIELLRDGAMVPAEAFKPKKGVSRRIKRMQRDGTSGRRGRSRLGAHIRSRSRNPTKKAGEKADKKKKGQQQQEKEEAGSLWEDASRASKSSKQKLLLEDGAIVPKEALDSLERRGVSKRIKNMGRSRSLVRFNDKSKKAKAKAPTATAARGRGRGGSGFKSPIRLRSLSRGRSKNQLPRVDIKAQGNLEEDTAIEIVEKIPSKGKQRKVGFTSPMKSVRSKSRGKSMTREKSKTKVVGKNESKHEMPPRRSSRFSSSFKGRSIPSPLQRRSPETEVKDTQRGMEPEGIVASTASEFSILTSQQSKDGSRKSKKSNKSSLSRKSNKSSLSRKSNRSSVSKKSKSLRGWAEEDDLSEDDIEVIENEIFLGLQERLVQEVNFNQWFNFGSKATEDEAKSVKPNKEGEEEEAKQDNTAEAKGEDSPTIEEEERDAAPATTNWFGWNIADEDGETATFDGASTFETSPSLEDAPSYETSPSMLEDSQTFESMEESMDESTVGSTVDDGWFNWTGGAKVANDNKGTKIEEEEDASRTDRELASENDEVREDADGLAAAQQNTNGGDGWFSPLSNYFTDTNLGDIGLTDNERDDNEIARSSRSRKSSKSNKSHRRSSRSSKSRGSSRKSEHSKSTRHVDADEELVSVYL